KYDDIDGAKNAEQKEKNTTEKKDQERDQGSAAPGEPGAASRTKPLYFEYDLAAGKLTLLEDYQPPRKPRWASVSPDEKTVVFARGHNLLMMDAENYAKARKKEDDASIVEMQITTDG